VLLLFGFSRFLAKFAKFAKFASRFREKDMADGGCLCGALRFTAEGAPKWTSYCHCASCRRHTGAPVSAYAGFEREKVRFTQGALARFSSSGMIAKSSGSAETPMKPRTCGISIDLFAKFREFSTLRKSVLPVQEPCA